MSNWLYGIVGADGGFVPTSTTEKGAKRHATNNGYTEVYKIHQISGAVIAVAVKTDTKWIPYIN